MIRPERGTRPPFTPDCNVRGDLAFAVGFLGDWIELREEARLCRIAGVAMPPASILLTTELEITSREPGAGKAHPARLTDRQAPC